MPARPTERIAASPLTQPTSTTTAGDLMRVTLPCARSPASAPLPGTSAAARRGTAASAAASTQGSAAAPARPRAARGAWRGSAGARGAALGTSVPNSARWSHHRRGRTPRPGRRAPSSPPAGSNAHARVRAGAEAGVPLLDQPRLREAAAHELERPVGRAVVDDDRLVGAHALETTLDPGQRVVGDDDDGDVSHGA